MILLNQGATVFSLKTKDKHGKFENIVLQYHDITEYYHNSSYFGATVGRVAGRIKDAKFLLDGKTYYLERTTKINILYTVDLTVSHYKSLLLNL